MFANAGNDVSMSILHVVQTNDVVSTQDHVDNFSDVLIITSATTAGGDINKSILWCKDVQGSDFIYAPTFYSFNVRLVITVAFIFVMAVTVVGNAVVIITIVIDRPLRRMTSELVLSMAAADILVALCGELQTIVMMLSTEARSLTNTQCEIFTSIDLYFSLSGLLHIVSLAGDRYLSICYPFRYERWGHRYTMTAVAVSWTLPIAFSFLPIMGHWYGTGQEDLYACLQDLKNHTCALIPNKVFSTASFIVMFALPCSIMCYCYTHIYKVAREQRKRLTTLTIGVYTDINDARFNRHSSLTIDDSGDTKLPHVYDEAVFIPTFNNSYPHVDSISNTNHHSVDPHQQKQQDVMKKSHFSIGHRFGIVAEEFKAVRSISIVFVCFTVTWLPYWVTVLFMPYLAPTDIPDPVIGICLWLAYLGSALNPFVYYFSNRAVKTGIRILFNKVSLHRLVRHNNTGSTRLS